MLSTTVKRMRQSSMHSLKAYDKSEHRVLVIGGNGFVGSNILQRAVQKGIEVRSLNPSGKPQWQDVPWIDNVDWHEGDVFDDKQLAKAVEGVTGVISTVGAFGNNEFMEKMCGDSTIVAARAAQKAGAERFVFVSNSRVGSYCPSWMPMYGYYHGKERAERAVQARFPSAGVALRPGFIYGWRRTKKGRGVPLQLIGAPISVLARDLGAFSTALGYLPLAGDEMRAAIPVGAVAKAAVLSAIGPVHGHTLDTTSMLELAASFHIHE
ncbi:NAD dependent epimerase/dehydratase [Phytophthora palmivora]|uniref:NAD dependent epimerase/dehydratase n=1 Tax=Phytophthora palmivora TaxID=4796 RepID=A0A2P4XMD3_9STRA|nr:NAD dependent epimerase/dehydratase [Phytophthora palmivora]